MPKELARYLEPGSLLGPAGSMGDSCSHQNILPIISSFKNVMPFLFSMQNMCSSEKNKCEHCIVGSSNVATLHICTLNLFQIPKHLSLYACMGARQWLATYVLVV